MIRTIRELIDALEEAAEQVGDDAEIRIGHQPSWPLELSIARVVTSADLAHAHDPDEGDYDPDDVDEDEGPAVAWITEGDQLGYASKRLWQEF